MQIYLILAAIIIISIAIFSFQNPFPILVYFLNWEAKGSLAIILIITFVAGILTSILITIMVKIKRKRSVIRGKKEIAEK
ncbi:LapA family protein [bacterium]|nr:LapA family protein [bacterium]